MAKGHGVPPVKLMVPAITRAAMSFPVGAGLGWDGLARVLYHCETTGRWPELVDIVVIALLPKPDGGLRPIGLMPSAVRIWTGARKEVTMQWEKLNHHPFLYAGKGMGADVAAWKQAARAELADTAQHKIGYAQALLDLVKAFDRIPHWLIVREAIALDYPLWFIRLSLQAYKLKRVIKVRKVVSKEVQASRGITAGSGTATTEMRLVMIRIILRAMDAHPTGVPSCFLDDLSAEMAGPDEHIPRGNWEAS